MVHFGGSLDPGASVGMVLRWPSLRWQTVPAVLDEMMSDTDVARARKVSDALLKMVKIDFAGLEAARRSS